MDFMSVKETAELWNVSERWVQKLCMENRIPDARRFGRSWMIPGDAVRPNDLRKKIITENNLEDSLNAENPDCGG